MSFLKLLSGAAVALSVSAASVQAETWDMATPYPDATFHTQNINQFAADVAAATDGALEINVHSAGSLFKHPEISKAVRSGQVPAGEFFLSLLNNDNPAFGVDSLPFLATNYDDAERLWAAQRPVVEELLDEQGLMVLYAVPWPPQGLYTTKSIATVDDLAGLKFRTYNSTLETFASMAGAAPTQIEVPDIAQAFSTGRVEAMITSPSTGVNSQAWDFLSNYTDIQAWIPKNIVVVNKRAFQRLDEATQQAVLEAAAAAETRGWEMSRAETDSQTAALAENGIDVQQPTEELMNGLRAIGVKMLEDWTASSGEAGAAILDAYNQ
ncbi:MAG: TRAP transporter substrate-binding protein [Proteobacteria bacterium]|nr:TRAP transporter substrate-binding protein [Pseudomonadota bacterium]